MDPLPVFVLWHLHQPLYRLPDETTFQLPWVRLHTLREYHDMAEMLERHPEVRVTVNWTPVLLQQIREYNDGYRDRMQELREPDPRSLPPQERFELLNGAFKAHERTLIEPFPRFADLHEKWQRSHNSHPPEQAVRSWTVPELRDVQIWSTLAWFGFSARSRIPELEALVERGGEFEESDKELLREAEQQLLGSCLNRWRGLHQQGTVEIATSPYFHPIGPLLCRYEDVEERMPGVPKPERRIEWPEDARWHLEEAKTLVEEVFELDRVGLWPSEGSLSQRFMSLIDEVGFAWTASDEHLLRASPEVAEQGELPPEAPYRVYHWQDRVPVFFRDTALSDRIGFDYSGMTPDDALADFLNALDRVRRETASTDHPSVCSVILDGENPWEYFADGGEGFLGGLYDELVGSPDLRPVTARSYLDSLDPSGMRPLQRMPAGSWIDGDFHIWAQHSLDVRAWELLAETREALRGWDLSPDAHEDAWRALYTAQGSDWFWWYGEPFESSDDEVFDGLFRGFLLSIYEIGGHPQPSYLFHPLQSSESPGYDPPRYFIAPTIDGCQSHYREWWGAARITHRNERGAMARSSERFQTLLLGSNLETLFGRIDFETEPSLGTTIRLGLSEVEVELGPLSEGSGTLTLLPSDRPLEHSTWTYDRIVEWSVPLEDVNLSPGVYCSFSVELLEDGSVYERFPFQHSLPIPILDKDQEAGEWTV